MYFIKNVTVIDSKGREHLAQARWKKRRRKLKKSDKKGPQTSNMARTQEIAPRDLSRLLTTSNMTTKSLYILVPGRPEKSA
jgi:hypothetical protein